MRQSVTIGVIFKLLNLLLFTLMSLFFMKFGSGIGTAQQLLMVCVWAVVILIPLIYLWPGATFHSAKKSSYFVRALCGVLGMWTWVEALRHINPNDATALSYTTPVLTLILASVFLHEKIRKVVLLSLLGSIIGAAVILYPSLTGAFSSYGAAMALASAGMWAAYDTVCKHQARCQEHYLTQALYTLGFSGIIITPLAYLQWRVIVWQDWLNFLNISGVRIANIIALFLAYKFAPINVLMPYSYLRLVFMAGLSYWLMGVELSWYACMGAVIIIASNGFGYIRGLKSA